MTLLTPKAVLEQHRVVICVGTGGVGKTTVSAAMALAAARAGRRTLVLTIDPARRLADALGIDALGNEPQRVSLPGPQSESLALHAMMLDPKRTFDGLIARFAPSEEVRRQILENPIYQHVSGALSGSGEYAAMEKVLEMAESDDFDLVVVDTPPAQHVLEFLDSPRRLVEFLDSRLVKLLVQPAVAAGRFGAKLFQRPVQIVLQLIERVTGVGFLEDLSAFLMAIDDMSDGFKQRADRIRETLAGPDTAFILIAGPGQEPSRNARMFLDHLSEARARLRGIVVNRMHLWPGETPPSPELLSSTVPQTDIDALAHALDDPAAARAAVSAASEIANQAHRDFVHTRILREHAEVRRCFFSEIEEASHDIHDLQTLSAIADALTVDAEVANR